ncbi:MAG: diacylglycerol kinase family protein [Roseivirga sp.]
MKERIRSFRYAFKGIWLLIRDEHNFRIHLLATVIVIFLGFYFRVPTRDWLWLILCIGMVLAAEGFNSVIEHLVDLKQPEQDPKAGKIKDLAAGAVLLTAFTALTIGIIIFWPYIRGMF